MQPKSRLVAVHLRCKFELFRLLAFVGMAAVIDDREIIWAIVFMAKIGHSVVQGCLPTFRGDLEKFSIEVEFAFEELPQLIHLKA